MPCDHNPVTIFPTQFSYVTINGEQVMTLSAVRLVYDTSGTLPIDRGGTGAVTPEQARINLGLGTAATADASDFATTAQGDKADTALQPGTDAAALASGPGVPLGYVLTADGAEGADWAAPQGGTGGGLDAVEDDPAPKLGGNLELQGHRILATDNADVFHGALGYSSTVGALFLSENTPGEYFEDKAGVSLKDGLLALHGSRSQVKALVGVGNREVWADPDGNLYPVEPAPPAWDVEDQSTGKIGAYGDVSGTGAWTKIPSLSVLTEQAVVQGDAIGCTTRAYINNLSPVGGDLEFGWGIGTAEPAAGTGTATVAVVQGQKGYVTANHYQEALANQPAGTEVAAWVRALGPPEFGPWIDGGQGYPHYLTIEAVGQPAQTGDVIITTDTTVYVEVTGNDTTGDGKTVGTAYATVQKAIDSIQSWIILESAFVTLQLGAGDFTISAVIRFYHPYGLRVKLLGVTATNQITGVVEADFTDPLWPLPGVRGAFDLYNSAGMLPTNASGATRSTARAQDLIDNEALLRTCYPTRVYNNVSASALSFIGHCADFGNILFKGSVSASWGCNVASGDSYAVISGAGMNCVNNSYARINKLIAVANAVGIIAQASQDATLSVGTLYAQGTSYGAVARDGGRVEIGNATISGCANSGVLQEAGGVITTPYVAVLRRISVTGCAASGLLIYTRSVFDFSSGNTGSLLNVSGNVNEQIYLQDSASLSTAPEGVTLRIQASPTAAGIRVLTKSRAMLDGPVELNGGTFAIYLQNDCEVAIVAAITYTNPRTNFIKAETNSVVFINGAITAAAGLGTSGISVINGARVIDAGSALSALAALYPTKFTPIFGKTLADGRGIIGGPVGTGALTIGETNITLDGADIVIAALAGVGNRTVKVDANGRLFAE